MDKKISCFLQNMPVNNIYELTPADGRKSFYGKALVYRNNKGEEVLYSYNTPIIYRSATGRLIKLWDGWTMTTGRHIKAFCGLNKKEYESLEGGF